MCIFSDSIWKKWNYYKHKANLFQRRTQYNYYLRNKLGNATNNLKIPLGETYFDVYRYESDIILGKQTNNETQIHLKVCDKWN